MNDVYLLLLLRLRVLADWTMIMPVMQAKKKVVHAVIPGMRLDGKSSAYSGHQWSDLGAAGSRPSLDWFGRNPLYSRFSQNDEINCIVWLHRGISSSFQG